jgi:hypothetical protein
MEIDMEMIWEPGHWMGTSVKKWRAGHWMGTSVKRWLQAQRGWIQAQRE